MNLTTSSVMTNTWKGIKPRFVVAACGVALALAVVATFASESIRTPSSGPARIEAPLAHTSQSPIPSTVVYLVATQEQANALAMAIADHASIVSSSDNYVIVLAETGAAAVPFLQAPSEIEAAFRSGGSVQTPNYNVIDLR